MDSLERKLFNRGGLSDKEQGLQSRVNMVFDDFDSLEKQDSFSPEIIKGVQKIRKYLATLVESIRLEDDSDSIRRIANPVKQSVEDLKRDSTLPFAVLQKLESVKGLVDALLNYHDIF